MVIDVEWKPRKSNIHCFDCGAIMKTFREFVCSVCGVEIISG